MGGAHADPARAAEGPGWETDGALTRAAATLHPEDDDFGQAGTLYRDVLDDDAKARLVANIAGHVSKVTRPELRRRVLQYWANVDSSLSQRVAEALEPSAPGADVSPEEVGIHA
jgi:catalase